MLTPFKRAYKFNVTTGGFLLLECDKITGIEKPRTVIEHADAQGDKVPLPGPSGITHLEFHHLNPSCADFFSWFSLPNPPQLTGNITVFDQSGIPMQNVSFYDMVPESVALDDLDRKSEAEHGSTYKVACVIISIS